MYIINLLAGLTCMVFFIKHANCEELSICTKYRLKISNTQILSCNMCPPGTYFIEDCTADDLNAKCSACPDGTYEPYHNIAYTCAPCTETCLSVREFKYQNCSGKNDTICRCKDGFYRMQGGGKLCSRIGPCPPGQGVTQQGDHEKNTVCASCDREYFSSSTSTKEPCKKCTECSPGSSPKQPWTAYEDTICVKDGLTTQTPVVDDGERSTCERLTACIVGSVVVFIVVVVVSIVYIIIIRRRLSCDISRYMFAYWKNKTVSEDGEYDAHGKKETDEQKEMLVDFEAFTNNKQRKRDEHPQDIGMKQTLIDPEASTFNEQTKMDEHPKDTGMKQLQPREDLPEITDELAGEHDTDFIAVNRK